MYKDTFKTINGDIVIENNDIALTSGVDELRQNLEHRYAMNKGEWFLNTETGLEYKSIVGKGVQDRTIDITIRECGFQDDRVAMIDDVNVDRQGRKAAISFKVTDKEDNRIGQEVESV